MSTAFQRFRRENGFDRTRQCGDCENFVKVKVSGGYLGKCKKLNLTKGTSTRVLISDPACKLFKKKEGDDSVRY